MSNQKIDIIKRVSGPTLDVLDAYGFSEHCIEAGALFTRVLHEAGIKDAYRLSVSVDIVNSAYRNWVEKHGVPQTDAEAIASNDAGGCQIMLGKHGMNQRDDDWDGHLAVVVPNAYPDQHALIDLTIPQANRPEFGIQLSPSLLKTTESFVGGERTADLENGSCLLRYTAYPADESYNQWGDWMEAPGFEQAVQQVLELIV